MKIPKNISVNRNGQYCLFCFNEGVERLFESDKTFYKCSSCNKINARSLVIDEKITSWIDKERIYWHESVGTLIKNDEGQIFCILRKIYPFEYALPAGHLDAREKAEDAASREVQEEIGVSLSDIQPLGHFAIQGDKCRRGCDDHMWNLFIANKPKDFVPKLSDEASEWKWMSKDELMNRNDIVYPLKYIAKKYSADIFLDNTP